MTAKDGASTPVTTAFGYDGMGNRITTKLEAVAVKTTTYDTAGFPQTMDAGTPSVSTDDTIYTNDPLGEITKLARAMYYAAATAPRECFLCARHQVYSQSQLETRGVFGHGFRSIWLQFDTIALTNKAKWTFSGQLLNGDQYRAEILVRGEMGADSGAAVGQGGTSTFSAYWHSRASWDVGDPVGLINIGGAAVESYTYGRNGDIPIGAPGLHDGVGLI